jgi:hypothetical protein
MFLASKKVQLRMSCMYEFFYGEAIFTPYDAKLIAVKANSLGNGLASTSAALLPIE